jgi:hypothetical protein
MRATISIFQGQHGDHGRAVYPTQQSRRCYLFDTTYGLSDDDARWAAPSAWASFHPWLANLRVTPGRPFYPDAYSRVFEKYWNYLPCLDQHPDFVSDSRYTQLHMKAFSEALSSMSLDGFQQRPTAEASRKDIEVSEDAAISHLRQIQDGQDYWTEHRSSAANVGFPRACLAGRGSTRRVWICPQDGYT